MKQNKKLPAVLGGTACAAFTAYAVWDSLSHHHGRLVYPMDSYAFQPSDIPMLLALTLDTIYIITLFVSLVLTAAAQRKQIKSSNHTRKLNPKMGFLGFLGFLGFAGFSTYSNSQIYFPFCFFVFFGFFGFFFEGKMSNTFMDERYRENILHAQRDAYRVGITVLFLLLVITAQSSMSASLVLPALLIGISLDLALTLFLSVFLLYRYDHDDPVELEDQ